MGDFFVKGKESGVASLFDQCSNFLQKNAKEHPEIDLNLIPYPVLVDMLVRPRPRKCDIVKLRFEREQVRPFIFAFEGGGQLEVPGQRALGRLIVPGEIINQLYNERHLSYKNRLFWKYVCRETERDNFDQFNIFGGLYSLGPDIYNVKFFIFGVFGVGIKEFLEIFDTPDPSSAHLKKFLRFCRFIDRMIVDICTHIGLLFFHLNTKGAKEQLSQKSPTERFHYGIYMLIVSFYSLCAQRELTDDSDQRIKGELVEEIVFISFEMVSTFFNIIDNMCIGTPEKGSKDLFTPFTQYYARHQLLFHQELLLVEREVL